MRPLDGNRWWLSAEDPWQCLAACFVLTRALELPDPTKLVSYLPVHQDGTCNGLQHYAALGGDSWGAKQVNLEPGDRPADVYTAVANLVKASIKQDKEQGDELAAYMDGKITRKTVKQTVMTNVYGVTFSGARAQVTKQLMAASNVSEEKYKYAELGAYIAHKIFNALSSMFTGAHDIQYWFGECANRITAALTLEQLNRLEAEWPRLTSRVKPEVRPNYSPPTIDELVQFKSTVIWTNPLHMPIVQPYRIATMQSVQTAMQKFTLNEPHASNPVNRRKQLQGLPPNFIHSLDATHMLLSALKCDELGLSFAAVHDSFWTHASDIDTMSNVLRDSFIRIHSEDVIGRLAAEFATRYKGCIYAAKLQPSSPIYQKICAWRAERKANKHHAKPPSPKNQRLPPLDELMLEYQRYRLLNSSDPSEIAQGRSMVTPGSIYEEMAREGDLAPAEELGQMGLGDIPSRGSSLNGSQQLDNSGLNGTISDVAAECLNEGEASEATSQSEKSAGKKIPTNCSWTERVWLPLTFPPVPKKVCPHQFANMVIKS